MSMKNQEPVGTFKFGGNSIQADPTGAFTIHFVNGGNWQFDLGEITRFADLVRRIESNQIKPDGQTPEVFWRTNGSKVIEVWTNASYVYLREGGTTIAYFLHSEIPQLLRHLRILTEGAPYHRIARLVDIVEKQRDETPFKVERFPLNNRGAQNHLKIEKEFTQETIRTIDIEASFGIGLDYWIAVNLETKFGLTKEQRISETIKVSMEASPGEHIEYRIVWKEVTVIGDAIFEISGVKEKVPFRLKSGLVPEVQHEVIARD